MIQVGRESYDEEDSHHGWGIQEVVTRVQRERVGE